MSESIQVGTGNPDADQLKDVFTTLVRLMKEQGMSSNDLMDIYQGSAYPDKRFVPLGIFATALSPSESLCKYLRENLEMSYKEIAGILNRDERSIWTSHNRSKEKMPGPFAKEDLDSSTLIPVKIFAERRRSIMENLVIYLKEKTGQTNYKIAKSLNKTPSMIYTVYKRARAKIPVQSAPKPKKKKKRPFSRRFI